MCLIFYNNFTSFMFLEKSADKKKVSWMYVVKDERFICLIKHSIVHNKIVYFYTFKYDAV